MSSSRDLQGIGARLATDESAVADAYAALAPTVLAYLRRMVAPPDVEDVLQRTFLEVWRCRGQYDPTRPLSGWVLGIARHRALDQLRSRRPEDLVERLPDRVGQHDDDLAERYSRAHDLRRALEQLSAEQRQVLVLAYFDDLSLPQVAAWVNAPLGTVKARASRGLRALAREMRG